MDSSQEVSVTCNDTSQPDHSTSKTKIGPPSLAVVETIAEIMDTDPDHIEPLYTTVDPDSLDQLFECPNDDGPRSEVEVSFSYVGYDVTISSATAPNDHTTELPSL